MADDIAAGNRDFQDVSTFAIDRFVEPIRRGFRLVSLALLVLVIVLPALQIFLREVTHTPFIGGPELSRFMLICTVFIAFPYVVSSGANIRMEEIQLALPAAIVRWLRPLISFLSMVSFAVIAYSTYVATVSNLNNATPTLGIPYYIFFSATFLGCLMTAFESAVQTGKAIAKKPLYVKFEAERPPDELTEL
ncbi:MAG: TRAP transporter small permease [Desulfobacteraceae bacterium]|nr:MAG: TRAP transporter small permease [Desulfobacteraceae bacterium]